MKRAMFPRKFLIWLIDDQEIFLGELSERYLINDNPYKDGKRLETLDEFYEYWRLEIEPKASEPKELVEIKEEDKTCRNCRNKVLSPISKPCSYCLGFDEWEPIK